MYLETERLIIRDLEFRDAETLFRTIWQKNVVRFMKDWSENNATLENVSAFIKWRRSQIGSTDPYENRRYAIARKGSDSLIGIVGTGLEDTFNEVEMAYFLDEDYQKNGYATEAVQALSQQYLEKNTSIPYLVLAIDCANAASCRVAERSGFELFEKRTPIGHVQPNMESDSYFYFRRHR